MLEFFCLFIPSFLEVVEFRKDFYLAIFLNWLVRWMARTKKRLGLLFVGVYKQRHGTSNPCLGLCYFLKQKLYGLCISLSSPFFPYSIIDLGRVDLYFWISESIRICLLASLVSPIWKIRTTSICLLEMTTLLFFVHLFIAVQFVTWVCPTSWL